MRWQEEIRQNELRHGEEDRRESETSRQNEMKWEKRWDIMKGKDYIKCTEKR